MPDETTVLCITGNGLKTTDVLADKYQAEKPIAAKLSEFEAYLASKLSALPARRHCLPRRRHVASALVLSFGSQSNSLDSGEN